MSSHWQLGVRFDRPKIWTLYCILVNRSMGIFSHPTPIPCTLATLQTTRQRNANLFHRLVTAQSRNHNKHLFMKATWNLRNTFTVIIESNTPLPCKKGNLYVCQYHEWFSLFSLRELRHFEDFQKNDDPSSAWIFSFHHTKDLLNYVMKRNKQTA